MTMVNPRLDKFVAMMREKMSVKRNLLKTDWRDLPREMLTAFLLAEIDETLEALRLMDGAVGIAEVEQCRDAAILEVADVANVAFMLGDWLAHNGGDRT